MLTNTIKKEIIGTTVLDNKRYWKSYYDRTMSTMLRLEVSLAFTPDDLKRRLDEYNEYYSAKSKYLYIESIGLLFKDLKPILHYIDLPYKWHKDNVSILKKHNKKYD